MKFFILFKTTFLLWLSSTYKDIGFLVFKIYSKFTSWAAWWRGGSSYFNRQQNFARFTLLLIPIIHAPYLGEKLVDMAPTCTQDTHPIIGAVFWGGVAMLAYVGFWIYVDYIHHFFRLQNATYERRKFRGMLENNPVTENLGVNTSTDNIPFPTNTILQIETVNLEQNSPNLGGKSFKFTGESLYFDMLHSIPTKIRGGDSFLYILGLGKFEYSPYYFELQEEFLSSHWYRYGRFKFGFTEFIKLNVPQPHTIPKLAAAHTQGISRFRVDSDFTRDLIYYTHEICPEITLNMVADTAITIPITYLA